MKWNIKFKINIKYIIKVIVPWSHTEDVTSLRFIFFSSEISLFVHWWNNFSTHCSFKLICWCVYEQTRGFLSCWFVGLSAGLNRNRFPPHLAGGRVSVQNRVHWLLVLFWLKGSSDIEVKCFCEWEQFEMFQNTNTWMIISGLFDLQRTAGGGIHSLCTCDLTKRQEYKNKLKNRYAKKKTHKKEWINK